MSEEESDDFEFPEVEAERLNWYQIGFTCPICGRVNRHGCQAMDYGHRGGHCECFPRGYILIEPGDEEG